MSVTQIRLERLVDERAREEQNIEDMRAAAEKEERDLNELETEMIEKKRTRIAELDVEVGVLADDLERAQSSRDVSKLIRVNEAPPNDQAVVETGGPGSPVVYRTFSAYAMDAILVRHPMCLSHASKDRGLSPEAVKAQAEDRLQRAVVDTTTTTAAGLVPPQHMAQILDIINGSRPVATSGRNVDLSRGKMTYPKIAQRPEVLLQSTEKTLAGTKNMQVTLEEMTASTYLGGGDLSWQTINWSTPDALQLWFDLAAEAYARQTETVACTAVADSAAGTLSPALGTAGTESLADWRSGVMRAIGSVYSTTSGRAQTNTLYLSADQFFYLAGLATDAVLQMSPVGNLDVSTMTGTFSGLKVVGSYGFDARTRVVGDSNAFLVGETPGAPVELRAVEPSIGGMEVGVIGAFAAKVYDTTRFLKLNIGA